MENTHAKELISSKTISPLQYVKVLIIFHLITIFTVIIDFIPCDIHSYMPKIIGSSAFISIYLFYND